MNRFLFVFAMGFVLNAFALPKCAQAQFGGMGPGGIGPGGGGRQMMFMQRNPTPHTSQDYAVDVTTLGGRSVTGKLALTWVVVNYDLGYYEIEPEKVKEIHFTAVRPERNTIGPGGTMVEGTIITTTGAEISGVVMVNNWKLQTDLGVLTLDAQGLKSLTIKGKAPVPDLNAAKPQQAPPEAKPAPKEPQSGVEKK